MKALAQMMKTVARVRRDGEVIEIDAGDLVPGDIVLMEAGNVVRADGRIFVAATLEIEEAALTGESLPVGKTTEPVEGADVPLGDRTCVAYMNTSVTRGRGEMIVTETGMQTEIGHIADLLANTENEKTRRLGVRAIAAVGTAGMRIARNSDDVIRTIHERTGITIEVIPGDEEGRLAYLAVQTGLGEQQGRLVVFDTGGGSSQFTFGEVSKVLERFSVDVGAVRYTERFGLDHEISPDVLREALGAISEDLFQLDDHSPPDVLVGMGGAVTNMTAVMLELATYDPGQVQGATLDRAEVDRQMELYRSRDADARRAIIGLQPKRAEVILAGACIVRTVMGKLGMTSLTVSDRGVRHGLLVDRFQT